MADLRAPPTPLAMIIGTAIIAGVSGYMIGIASSLGLIPNPFVAKEARTRGISNYDDEEESAEEDIDESDTRPCAELGERVRSGQERWVASHGCGKDGGQEGGRGCQDGLGG